MTTKLPETMVVNPDVILTEMKDGSGVLLDMRTKFYFTLNETGVFAWKKIHARAADNIELLADAVTREFEVERATARVDLERVLTELVAEGLVTGNLPRGERR